MLKSGKKIWFYVWGLWLGSLVWVFGQQPPIPVAGNLIVSPLPGAESPHFDGLLDPPVDPHAAFVITGGLANGLRLTTVAHFPWFSSPAWPICQDPSDIFCPSIAGPVPPDVVFKLWLYQNGSLVHEQEFPTYGLQFDAGHTLDLNYAFQDGNHYTLLAGYQSDTCSAGPPCIARAAQLFWRMPSEFIGQETYYIQRMAVSDWPNGWPGGSGFGGQAPAALSFYYESRPPDAVFLPASQWRAWPAASNQMATNYGSELQLQNTSYTELSWTLRGPQNYAESATLDLTDADPAMPVAILLPDLTSNPNLFHESMGFQLEIQVTNIYGLTASSIIELSSFRPLRFDMISWDIHYEDLGTGIPDKHQSGLPTQRLTPEIRPSCFVPDFGSTQDIVFEIEEWGPNLENLAAPAQDYNFTAGVLLNERDSNNNNKVANPQSTSDMRATISNFLLDHSWFVTGSGVYPGGDYVELALLRVEDERSGNARGGPQGDDPSPTQWTSTSYQRQEHRLRLDRLFGENPCTTTSSVTLLNSNDPDDVATEYLITPGNDLPIWFLPQFDNQLFDPDHPHDRIDYVRLTFFQNGQDLGLSFPHNWSRCESRFPNDPALLSDRIETITIPANLTLSGTGITLSLEACYKRDLLNQGDNCSALPVVLSTTIPILVDGVTTPGGTLDQFELEISGPSPNAAVDTATGEVNFGFIAEPDAPPAASTRMEWRWYRLVSGDPQYWRNGQWGLDDSFHTLGANSSDVFSRRWAWQEINSIRYILKATPPFAPTNPWIGNFFGGQNTREIHVEARLRYDANTVSNAETVVPFTVVAAAPSGPLDLGELQGSVAGGPWLADEVTYLEGEVGDLAIRVTTADLEDQSAQFSAYRYRLLGGENAICEGVLTAFAVSYDGSGSPTYYRLTPINGSPQETQLNQVGQYRLEIVPIPGECGPAPPSLSLDINVNPAVVAPPSRFMLRLHYRDHLGTSLVSKAFRTEVPGGGARGTVGLHLGGTPLTLSGHPVEYHFYEPFGEPLAVSSSDTDHPRYTDHEHDPFSGLNYMKGRFQMGTLTKFNRPDPQRDWDWENPQSINLYEYVGNDPISAWDPTGLGVANIKLVTEGKNKVNLSRRPTFRTLASPNPSELGYKDQEYHKNYLINVQAQLEPEDDPSDFVVEQSAIGTSNEGITQALDGDDSPESYALSFDKDSQVLSMVDAPGLSSVGQGHDAETIEQDDFVAVFSTTVKHKETGEGKTVYWQVIIQVNGRGETTFQSAEKIDQEEYEMIRDGLSRSMQIEPQDP